MTKDNLSVHARRTRADGNRGRIAVQLCSALAAAGAVLVLAGCTPPPPAAAATGAPQPGPTTRVVTGDWDDVDAAVRTAVRQCQLAIEERAEYRERPDGPVTVVDYTLRTVRGDSGRLRVRRMPGEPGFAVSCRLGAFGSAEHEACIVDRLEARLRRLEGRDYAPLGG